MKKQSKRSRSSKRLKTITELSAGAVVFFVENKVIKVLALAYSPDNDAFDMPKGHIERGETSLSAAQREIREEIGIQMHLDSGFQHESRYFFYWKDEKTGRKERISKDVTFFLAFMHPRERKHITVSQEHSRYYFLPIDEAIEKSKFADQKELLKHAKEYITLKYIT